MARRRWNYWALSRRLWRSPGLIMRGSRAHLAEVVKRNSSGIEVWRGSLSQAGSTSRDVLIEKRLKLWIHLNVDYGWPASHRQHGRNLNLLPIIYLLNFIFAILFEHFTLLFVNNKESWRKGFSAMVSSTFRTPLVWEEFPPKSFSDLASILIGLQSSVTGPSF